MSKLRDSIPRSQIKNGGVNVCGSMTYWSDTWHDTEYAEWSIAKSDMICVFYIGTSETSTEFIYIIRMNAMEVLKQEIYTVLEKDNVVLMHQSLFME
jgi:hypothetical protein